MTLLNLRRRLYHSLEQIRNAPILNKIILQNCLKEITNALLQADFPESHVNEMEKKIQEIINLPNPPNKYRLIYQIIFRELCNMLDPGKSALIQEKREPSIVMFIGLRGVGKTEICAKYARYHLKKRFKPGLVCADTFRTDAFLRLKRAVNDKIPVYGSHSQDPVEVAVEGIETFSKEKRDLIIIYTNDRHKQYSSLFEEMRRLAEAMKPDLVIYVMDSSIGQAVAFDQAQAFKKSFTVGVVIVTDVKSNSKACGTLCAVAEAKCPMILAETSSTKFEAFEVKPFVMRLLRGDQCEYTLRKMYESYQFELKLRNNVFLRFASIEDELGLQMRQYVAIMDSMTDEELDSLDVVKLLNDRRVMEIAKESKVEVREVVEMIKTFKRKAKLWAEIEEENSMINHIRIEFMEMVFPSQVGSTTEKIKHTLPFDPLSIGVRSKTKKSSNYSL